LLIPFLILLLFNTVIGFLADWVWHASLGYESILWTRVLAALGLFVAGFALTWLFLAVNFWIARRVAPRGLAMCRALRSFSVEALSRSALTKRPGVYQTFFTSPSTGLLFECTLNTFMNTLIFSASRSR
jgi:uncharacterized membrane protein (UPF0182 family)